MQCDSNHFVMPDLIRHPVDLWPSGEQFIILLDTGMRRYDGLCRGIRNSYSNHFVMPDLIRHPVDLWPSGAQFIILLDTGMRRYDGLCRGIRNSYSNYFVMRSEEHTSELQS